MAVRIARSTSSLEPRLEMTPLMDVVFLLLSFFIYAMVLLIRADILPVNLPELSNGKPATQAHAISITLDQAGKVFVDGKATTMDTLVSDLEAKRKTDPTARIYLAASVEGSTDRLPTFLQIVNLLRGTGDLKEFFIVGKPEK